MTVWFFVGLVIGLALMCFFLEWIIRPLHESIVAAIAAERDEARRQAQTYLGILCPRIKTDAVSEDTRQVLSGTLGEGSKVQPRVSPQAAPVQKARPFFAPPMTGLGPRIPFRKRFNLARRMTNTPQQKTDALAQALAQQKVPAAPGENHV